MIRQWIPDCWSGNRKCTGPKSATANSRNWQFMTSGRSQMHTVVWISQKCLKFLPMSILLFRLHTVTQKNLIACIFTRDSAVIEWH